MAAWVAILVGSYKRDVVTGCLIVFTGNLLCMGACFKDHHL